MHLSFVQSTPFLAAVKQRKAPVCEGCQEKTNDQIAELGYVNNKIPIPKNGLVVKQVQRNSSIYCP